MIIRSVQATFGKLDDVCLRFQSGLNVVEAPNEWGKSTWSAFILAMFYGLDTKARSTKLNLADKERYMPWSGKPMQGKIELEYDGRNITIERSTKGRIPLGSFRAYETDTGIDIPEIRSDNCGEFFLGVEQSVFRRSGFVRMSDMAITEDDALRRRLSDLVTTGDESGDAAALEAGLKALKSRLSNRSNGLIQQAQSEYHALTTQIEEANSLDSEETELSNQLSGAEARHSELLNHKRHLENQKAQKDAMEVHRALGTVRDEQERVRVLEEKCKAYPDADSARETLGEIRKVDSQLAELNAILTTAAPQFQISRAYAGLTPGEAVLQTEKDIEKYKKTKRPIWLAVFLLSVLSLATGLFVYFHIGNLVASVILLLFFIAGLGLSISMLVSARRQRIALQTRYGSDNTRKWELAAAKLDALWNEYNLGLKSHQRDLYEVREHIAQLEKRREFIMQGREAEYYFQAISVTEQLADAKNDLRKAQENYRAIAAMAVNPVLNLEPDKLDLSMNQTEEKIIRESSEIERIKGELQLIRYRKNLLGEKESLSERKQSVSERIEKLQILEKAVLLALQVHQETVEDLHRRFSPAITRQAQDYLQIMTGQRYNKILLNQSFVITAGKQDDMALRDLNYRSDGTIDQIYLSVRLAVAKILSPDAPMIFDDAFVRFDDERLENVLSLLQKISKSKQIILFTCQSRENMLINQKPRSS